MRSISVIPLILATMLAMPFVQAHPTEATPSTFETNNFNSSDSSFQDKKIISVVACSLPNLDGGCSVSAFNVYDGPNQCGRNFPSGIVKSLTQSQGAVCIYYRDTNCAAGNHSPSKRIDTAAAVYSWKEMGEWEGKVLSFSCSGA